MIDFKKKYKDNLELIKEAKWFIVFMFATFCLFFILGFTFQFLKGPIVIIVKNLALSFEGLNTFQIISKIFSNNLRSSLFGMLLGTGLGFFSIFSSLFNGYISGLVAREAVNSEGLFILWKLVPHGIFELTAIFISLGVGLFLAYKFLEETYKIKNKKMLILILFSAFTIALPILFSISMGIYKLQFLYTLLVLTVMTFVIIKSIKNPKIKKYIGDSLVLFAFVVIPLLLIGAIIEGLLMYFFP